MMDGHRPLFIVVGSFFGLLLLLWVFDLWGLRAERGEALDVLEALEKDRQAYTNPDHPWRVSLLLADLRSENETLQATWDDLRGELLYEFPPLFPEEGGEARPAQWVRERHRRLVSQVGQELESSRGIEIGEEARDLGFTFQTETTESFAEDVRWLKHMYAIERFVDLLGSVGRTETGEPHIKRLLAIQSKELEPRTVGGEGGYMEEWPIEAKILVTQKGLDELLLNCSRPELLHRVVRLTIDATPGETLGQEVTVRADGRRRQWVLQYYPVTVRVATLATTETTGGPVEAETPEKEDAPPKRRGRVLY